MTTPTVSRAAVSPVGGAGLHSLTDRQRAVLEFERLTWPRSKPGLRDQAIWDRFGWRPPRYAQVLTSVLQHPAALAYDAQLVGRLQRLAAQRRAQAGRPERAS